MKVILDDLAAQHAELWSLLESLGETQWSRPSPCEGWDIADVVLHLHQTDRLAIASVRGDLGPDLAGFFGTGGETAVDDAAAASVASERGARGSDIGAEWRASAAELRAALADIDPSARLQWVAGQLSARTLAATRLAECWIHTGDVATALGVVVAPTNGLRHIARLAWRTLPYAFARSGRALAGPVAFDLVAPGGEHWSYGLDDAPVTVVRGPAADLCAVAGRRAEPGATALRATGPDAATVLELVRTYA